ncbi:hypothetical protein ACFV6E_25130 [Streptomyces sp. NPDC059785]|uniref:restriction endonuclease subunit S n=1 Tax=Streptomyces sp. NPDC059785 TaxID=3346945 RepID=UPI0036623068
MGDVLLGNPRNGYSPKAVAGWTGLQALGLGCLTANGFAPIQLKNVPDTPLARAALLSDGDLLMSRANTRELVGLVGRYRSTGRPTIYPDLMMRLRTDEDRCLSEYLEIVLRSARVRREVTTGARGTSESMVKIGAELVTALEIPLPMLSEQRRIVAAYTAFERRISNLERVREKVRLGGEALRTHSLRCSFDATASPLGGMLIDIETGLGAGTIARQPMDGEWGVLRLSAFTSGRFARDQAKCLPVAGPSVSTLEIRDRDVLMVRVNGAQDLVGAVRVARKVRSGLLLSDLMYRLVPDEDQILSEFLGLVLEFNPVRQQIRQAMRGSSGQFQLPKSQLEAIRLPKIDVEEQQRIVAANSAFGRRIENIERKIVKCRTVQQAVVESLLGQRVLDSVA